jgi:lysozyme family protein
MSIEQDIAALIDREGGYVDNPADRGGPTRYGITQATARAHGYKGDMASLPQATAAQIYRADYWTVVHFDLVSALAPRVAEQMFDIGVNCGQGTAVTMLQRALNVLFGSALKTDGVISPGGSSLATLKSYLAQRSGNDDETVLLEMIACFQGERYAELVERNAAQRAFIYGWIATRVGFGLELAVPPHLST